jgi:hypothetical protein
MEQAKIDKDLIGDPSIWRLYLRPTGHDLNVMLFNIAADGSLIHRRYPLDPADRLSSLQEIVYDNPTLLSDFRSADVIIPSPRFTVIPSAITDPDTCRRVLSAVCPDTAGLTLLQSPLSGLGATILFADDTPIVNFIRRTFNNPAFHHHLAPLCRYFRDKSRIGNSRRMFANLRPGFLDIIVFDSATLRLANTYPITSAADAAYFIIAVRQMLGLDPLTDELLLAGDHDTRQQLTPMLREYIAYVMPVIFPSTMYRAGSAAAASPFDLIIMPLCV